MKEFTNSMEMEIAAIWNASGTPSLVSTFSVGPWIFSVCREKVKPKDSRLMMR